MHCINVYTCLVSRGFNSHLLLLPKARSSVKVLKRNVKKKKVFLRHKDERLREQGQIYVKV